MDGETEQSEKGFLRVLGYAWKKHLEEAGETVPKSSAVHNQVPATEEIAA